MVFIEENVEYVCCYWYLSSSLADLKARIFKGVCNYLSPNLILLKIVLLECPITFLLQNAALVMVTPFPWWQNSD